MLHSYFGTFFRYLPVGTKLSSNRQIEAWHLVALFSFTVNNKFVIFFERSIRASVICRLPPRHEFAFDPENSYESMKIIWVNLEEICCLYVISFGAVLDN